MIEDRLQHAIMLQAKAAQVLLVIDLLLILKIATNSNWRLSLDQDLKNIKLLGTRYYGVGNEQIPFV